MVSRKIIVGVTLLLMVGTTGFSQSLSLRTLGKPFKCSPSIIRWNAPTNSIPSSVWIYHLEPKTFPPEAVSNLIASFGFTAKNEVISNNSEVFYASPGSHPSKQLGISSSHGIIFYEEVTDYGPTNLASDVPQMSQMLNLTTNFLSALGIDTSEIPKNSTSSPNFRFWEPFKEYFIKDKIVTNIEFRAVDFRRSVGGGNVLGAGTAGNGEMFFGEHGRPVKIDIAWPDLKRYKSYPR